VTGATSGIPFRLRREPLARSSSQPAANNHPGLARLLSAQLDWDEPILAINNDNASVVVVEPISASVILRYDIEFGIMRYTIRTAEMREDHRGEPIALERDFCRPSSGDSRILNNL
jgi:hypothetical protein